MDENVDANDNPFCRGIFIPPCTGLEKRNGGVRKNR